MGPGGSPLLPPRRYAGRDPFRTAFRQLYPDGEIAPCHPFHYLRRPEEARVQRKRKPVADVVGGGLLQARDALGRQRYAEHQLFSGGRKAGSWRISSGISWRNAIER